MLETRNSSLLAKTIGKLFGADNPNIIAEAHAPTESVLGYEGGEIMELRPKFNHETGARIQMGETGDHIGFNSAENVLFSQLTGKPLTVDNIVALKKPGRQVFCTREEAEQIAEIWSPWKIVNAADCFHIKTKAA